MKIKTLNIGSFGKLSDVNINLDDKITVIYGKNEAGKSTISSFIKYMMYGFSQKRPTSLKDNEKKKYTPWDADEIYGEMSFESADKNTYTAVRKNATRAQSSIFDNNNMPVFQGQSAGEVFLGISDECYKRTAFVGQNDISFSDEGELQNAINNIMNTADESIDTAKALKKLEDLRKFLLGKTQRSGKIYEIIQQLEVLTAQKEKWQNGHKELLESEAKLDEIKNKIAFNKQRLSEIQKQMHNLSCLEAKDKLESLVKAKNDAVQDKKNFEELFKVMQNGDFVPDRDFFEHISSILKQIENNKSKKQEFAKLLDGAKGALDNIYTDRKLKALSEKIRQQNTDSATLMDLIGRLVAQKKKSFTLAIVLTVFVVTIPVALVFYLKHKKLSNRIGELCSKYGFENVKEFVSALEKDKGSKAQIDFALNTLHEVNQKIAQSDVLLKENYRMLKDALSKAADNVAQDDDMVIEQAKKYVSMLFEWLQRLDQAKQKCNEAYVRYNTLVSTCDMENLKALADEYDENIPVKQANVLKQEHSFYSQANTALEERERELEKKTAVITGTLPKPAEIQSTIESLTVQKQDLEQKHSALELALETLQKASDNMKSTVTPAIAEFSGNMFGSITSGKYKGLYTDNQMNLSFLQTDSAQVRDAGYLSCGTLDAAYISLRMALCTYLCKEAPVVVFDDAFCNLDDDRLAIMLEFLYSLSDKFQIIILTCHTREAKVLKDRAKIINFEIK